MLGNKFRGLFKSLPGKNSNSLGSRLIKGAAGSFGLRIAYTGLTLITSVILARLLGVTDFGVYVVVLNFAALLRIPSTLGIDNLLVREIAVYHTDSQWRLMGGMLRWADRIVMLVSVVIATTATGIAWGIWSSNYQMWLTFCLGMMSLPFTALRNLKRLAMRGLNRLVTGLIPEMLIAPLLLLILVGCAYGFLGKDLDASWVWLMNIIATVITWAISVVLLAKILPQEAMKAKPQYQPGIWLRSALPFMFLESLQVINARADILMLGAFKGVEAAGIYVPVNRGSQLIAFIFIAFNGVLAPIIASDYAQGKKQHLQKAVTKSARSVLLVATPLAIGLSLGGYWYLSLFGEGFTEGQGALNILCLGQLAIAATCFGGLLLNMTGHERYTATSSAVSVILNVLLNAWFIPLWGVEGAALATVISLVFLNILHLFWVRKKLKISATALGKFI